MRIVLEYPEDYLREILTKNGVTLSDNVEIVGYGEVGNGPEMIFVTSSDGKSFMVNGNWSAELPPTKNGKPQEEFVEFHTSICRCCECVSGDN